MGYALCMGACINCGRAFSFNPLRVPSIPIDGARQPVCLTCVEHANPIRRAKGLPEIVVQPDAYEACREEELP